MVGWQDSVLALHVTPPIFTAPWCGFFGVPHVFGLRSRVRHSVRSKATLWPTPGRLDRYTDRSKGF